MQTNIKYAQSGWHMWRNAGYSVLVLALLLSSFFPLVATAAPVVVQPVQKTSQATPERERPDPEREPTAPAEPVSNAASQPGRNALTGNPLTFVNPNYITINDRASANPYPSVINVQGIITSINGLTVSLYGFSHRYAADADILLVSPGGQKTLLMSDTGGDNQVTNLNLTFDDNAANSLPNTTLSSGTYKPTNLETPTDVFSATAPAGPYSATLSVFTNTFTNGDWQLYIMDDLGGGAGSISGGWSITFYNNQPAIIPTGGSNQSISVTTNFATPLQATVRDDATNPVNGAVVTFTVPAGGASATFAGGATSYVGTTDAQGVVTTPVLTANTVAGSYIVTAAVATAPAVANFALTNLAGSPATVTVSSGNNQTALINAAFPQSLAVMVKDIQNNPVNGAVVTFTAPLSGARGTFAGGITSYTATTNIAGLVTATTFTANATTGTYNVAATASGVANPVNFNLTNGPASQILFGSTNYTGTEGTNAAVTLIRGVGTAGAITVSVALSDITTAAGDYTQPPLTGGLDTTFNSGSGANAEIYTIRTLSDDKLLISGSFTAYNGVTRNRIARLNKDGSVDTSFDSSVGANGLIESTAIQPDGKIIIVGSFTTYASQVYTRIARLNSDGTLDATFNPGTGANNTISEVALQPDGKIIIGGTFTNYNNTARNRIIRLNSDGSLDDSFVIGSGLDANVLGLAVQTSGKVVVGGFFTTYNGATTAKLLQLNSDGSLDTAFGSNVGAGPSNSIWVLNLQPDGKILIGGDFNSFSGTTRSKMARVNVDGTLDTTFNPGIGPNSGQRVFTLQPDGKMLIAGDFTGYNSSSRGHIARINTDGSLDTTFEVGTGANDYVGAIALQSDGRAVFGGRFSSYNGVNQTRIARLGNSVNVSWADGDTASKIITLPLTHDGLQEGNEQLLLTLTAVNSPHTLGSPLSTTLTILDGDAKVLTANSGGEQSVAINQPFAQPLVAKVATVAGDPVSGVVITFTAPVNGATGTFVGGSATYVGTTDVSGLVTTTVFTANSAVGSYNVGANMSEGNTPVNFYLTNLRATTSLSLTSTPNPSLVGQSVMFTATLSPLTASGSVTFTIDGANIPANLVNGIATYATNTLTVGNHSVVANYPGNATYVPSQSAIYTHTVVSACNPLVVTAISDNGAANSCGTFSYALLSASSGTTITFALTQGNIITFTGSLTPTVKPGVTIDGGPNRIILNGNGVVGDGLRLGTNTNLLNLTIRRFAGREIVALPFGPGAGANRLIKVLVEN